PSCSTGFSVAITRNGSGSGRATPSAVTCRSSIASSRADWVFGGVRLISSARKRFVKIGPSRNLNVRPSPDGSSTSCPVTSEGMRSGVHCTREKSSASEWASALTNSVLATPGTPSSSTWPPTSSAATRPERVPSWPTTTLPTSSRSACTASLGERATSPANGGGVGSSDGLVIEHLLADRVELGGQRGEVLAARRRRVGQQGADLVVGAAGGRRDALHEHLDGCTGRDAEPGRELPSQVGAHRGRGPGGAAAAAVQV